MRTGKMKLASCRRFVLLSPLSAQSHDGVAEPRELKWILDTDTGQTTCRLVKVYIKRYKC